MTEKVKKKDSGEISRREFLKDAGLLVGGAAIGSGVILAACGDGDGATITETDTVTATKTVTSTAPGDTVTVTTTAGEVTKTITTTTTAGDGETVTVTKTVEVPGPGVAAENVVKCTINGKQYELRVEPHYTFVMSYVKC
jgi:hypothetical protein